MSVIKAKVTDQLLKITEAPVVASGGVNEIKVEFDFCEKWDGFAKTAIFYQDETEIYYALVNENDVCIVPWEVCYADGTFNFTVFGEKGDVRRTSTTVRYKVRKGIMTENMMPSDPSPEIYDQILADLARMRAYNEEFVEATNNLLNDIQEENKSFVDATNEVLENISAENDAFVAETLKALEDATKHNIDRIEKTATNGLVDIYTIYYLDGSTKTYTLTNGYIPVKGKDYFDGDDHVYVGSDTPPDTATIWIDPTGEPTSTEEWEFDMEDGTTKQKTVVVVN